MATTVKVLKEFFGFLPGQSLQQFGAELKALSDPEKQELAEGAAKCLGLTLDPPTGAPGVQV